MNDVEHDGDLDADLSRSADIERVRAQTIEKFGQLDVGVANAGSHIMRVVWQLTDDVVDDMVTTNFQSVLYGIQAVLPHFRERRRGHLIAVSSMLCPEFPDSFASTVFPGVVATEFGNNSLQGGPDSRAFPMAQRVDEVANVIADLIERPQAEVYTRPETREMVGRCFSAEEVGVIEAGPPFVVPRR